MKRRCLCVGMLLLIIVLAFGVAPAFAATPNNQACLGHDTSTYARFGNSSGLLVFSAGAGFGQVHKSIVRTAPVGFGDNIQAHLAGKVPDTVLPNGCND